MAQFTYPLTSAGVLGHKNGVYPDSLTNWLETFEDGGITEYGGDTAAFSVKTDTVYEGSYALDGGGTDNSHQVIADTGVTVQQGDTIEFRFYGDSGASGQNRGDFAFAAQNENGAAGFSGYSVRMNAGGSDMRIQKWSSGSITTLTNKTSNVGQPQDAWFRGKLTWKTDGTISYTLYDSTGSTIDSLSTTDTTYTSGGIGFHKYDSGCHYDAVKTI